MLDSAPVHYQAPFLEDYFSNRLLNVSSSTLVSGTLLSKSSSEWQKTRGSAWPSGVLPKRHNTACRKSHFGFLLSGFLHC